MACASQSMISANSCAFTAQRFLRRPERARGNTKLFSVRASSEEPDCNVEECAPDKEVGKVSMEWLAGEKTKVVGTFPPRKKGWTGYVEKDTAGQTNIYSVEPAVYVAESVISSGSPGTSAEGAEKTTVVVASLALISIVAASSILLQVSKNTPQVQSLDYSGPPLSYYINKFKPVKMVEASVPSKPQTSSTVETSILIESESSPTVEASIPPAPQVPSDVQSESNVKVVPEIQVKLKEQVVTQSPSVSTVP